MGLRSNGQHVFGVILKRDTLTREATDIAVVEATGYAIHIAEGGPVVVFSDKDGNIVERFGPGGWEDIDIDFTDDPEGFKVGEEPEGFYDSIQP